MIDYLKYHRVIDWVNQSIDWFSYRMILAASSASGFVQWRLARIRTADASLIQKENPQDKRTLLSDMALSIFHLDISKKTTTTTTTTALYEGRSYLDSFAVPAIQDSSLEVRYAYGVALQHSFQFTRRKRPRNTINSMNTSASQYHF